MIIRLPIVPANFKNIEVGDTLFFHHFKEWDNYLIPCAISDQKVIKAYLSPSGSFLVRTTDYFMPSRHFCFRGTTAYPFNPEMDKTIGQFPTQIYRWAEDYYSFVYATFQTEDQILIDSFNSRFRNEEEERSRNTAFLESHGITDEDSLIAKLEEIIP
jgi:hypothetical protein